MVSFFRRYLYIAHIHQKGQVLLITVLIMVVSLTIGLSVVSRSIIQVKNAKDEADSQKAFSAAEAGIEQSLKTGSPITNQIFNNNATINKVTINSAQSATIVLNNGAQVLQDEGADLWLSTYPTYANPWNGRVRVYWGTTTGCSEAAIEAIVISKPAASYTMTRYTYDPCSNRASGASPNNFSQPVANSGGTVAGKTFNYSFPIDVVNGLIMRIIPLYTNTTVGVIGYSNSSETSVAAFPTQGVMVTSIGSSGSTQREVSYFQGYNKIPSELFYSLFLP